MQVWSTYQQIINDLKISHCAKSLQHAASNVKKQPASRDTGGARGWVILKCQGGQHACGSTFGVLGMADPGVIGAGTLSENGVAGARAASRAPGGVAGTLGPK
jgi:hypothetical protein